MQLILGMSWLNELIGKLLALLGMDITSRLGGSIQFFLFDTIKIFVLLSLLIGVISYIQSYFPPERSKKILGRFRGLGANTIAAISGSIASPTAWSDGTTKGFGFTLMSAPGLDGKWGSGANYAAAPGSATTYYTRTGASNSVKDVVAMRLKADTTLSTPAGQYTNQLTITGTITP